jgi:hypothetical protein
MQTLSIAQQIYQTNIKDLPIVEQLKLVQLVLSELINAPGIKAIDESTMWSSEDYLDLTQASLMYAAQAMEGL